MKTLLQRRKIYRLLSAARFLASAGLQKSDGTGKTYPLVIQLPITSKCNSRCVMCDIWNMDSSGETTVEGFAKFMQDPIFKKVKAVGINGGEPSLLKNLPQYAREILKLPKLRSLNIISNGLNKGALLEALEVLYKDCQREKVKFHVSISLDGCGVIHDTVRGVPGAFHKTVSVIDEISNNKSIYCDSIDVGCTVVNHNVNHLVELHAFAKSKNYNIKYRLGVSNKRIGSDRTTDKYCVISNANRQSAKEFFHFLVKDADNVQEKYKYFSIFSWLNSQSPERMLGCMWRDRGITLDSRGNLYYCAVASDAIGRLINQRGEDVFFAPENIAYRKKLISHNCDKCIHDYNGQPLLKDVLLFFKDRLSRKTGMWVFLIKARLL